MKVLWITNQATPQLAEAMKVQVSFGGGWMAELSTQLSNVDNVKLTIAYPIEKKITKLYNVTVGKIDGIGIPMNKNSLKVDGKVIEFYEEIINSVKPDVVHIWGTEYVHSYCAVLACEKLNYLDKAIISIQGLVSVYANHFWGYINKQECRVSFRDILKRTSISKQQREFRIRGKFEVEAIKKVNYIIGRTDWDKACIQQINYNAKYYFCNETLRKSFYSQKWNITKCKRNSIFVSQCQYPIKGLHMLLQAMPKILERYPNAHIFTTGRPKIRVGFKEFIKLTSYDLYLRKLINKYKLQENITFLGSLNEEEMRNQYCKSHVFLSPSSIENSPNSVGEAMLLGVPVVSSDVGGVKNMMIHGREGYIYPADEPYMIAYYICEIFGNDEIANIFRKMHQYTLK